MRQESGAPRSENSSECDFSNLNISEQLKKGIKELGYTAPTAFQKGVFEHFSHGKNVVGEGQSNYGKSLAFSLPILSKIEVDNPVCQALIICENFAQSDLAMKECRALGRHLNIKVENAAFIEKWLPSWPQLVTSSVDDLEKMLKAEGLGPIKTIFFDNLSVSNAQKAIVKLGSMMSSDSQILIFGQDTLKAFNADAPSVIENAALVNNSDQPKMDKPATHIMHQAKDDEPKPRALLAALLLHNPKSALITCNEASEAELLSRFLMRYGFKTVFSSEEQNRQAVLDNLALVAGNKVDAFICQNNLLAGQNLSAISFMINFDMIERPQVYEHTTQFNKQAPGLSRVIVNLLTSRELGYEGPIKAQCLIEFETQALPSGDGVIGLASERIIRVLNAEASSVELGQFESLAQNILADKAALPAVALLLRNHFLAQSNRVPERERERPSYERRRPERRDERPMRNRPHHVEAEADAPKEDQQNKNTASEIANGGSTRLYVTLGRQDGLDDLASLAQYLSDHSTVDLGHFSGTGMLREHSAHIEVDNDVVDQIINAIHGTARPATSKAASPEGEKGASIVCERARQAPERKFHRPQGRHRNYNQRRR